MYLYHQPGKGGSSKISKHPKTMELVKPKKDKETFGVLNLLDVWLIKIKRILTFFN